MSKKIFFNIIVLLFVLAANGCKDKARDVTQQVVPPQQTNDVESWLTKGDESIKLQKQTDIKAFGIIPNNHATIEVDESLSYQTIDGFGFTLTGGSAQVINQLNPVKKAELLQELFGSGNNDIGISYLRVSIGASDLSSSTFTYNDMPNGQTDIHLNQFSLSQDTVDLIPLLKAILLINPNIKILGSPWSAPIWMKNNNSFIGGSLQTIYYDAYANYLVKYIQQMRAAGIVIDAITPQNEPLHGGNNPSMLMTAAEQLVFIKNHLGPALRSNNINTKIIVYDHNCDKPEYPLLILNDPAAKAFVHGSAFHLYAGNISALGSVYAAHPDRSIYFTEQYTASNGNFGGDLKWHLKNVIVGSMRNWSKTALEWNLANNAAFGPHTPGGCTTCKGAVTIESSNTFTRNVAYYIIAHASKFVPAGSKRISSSISGNLNNVAFLTPGGKKVLIVENDGAATENFNIRYNGKWVVASLDAGAVGTYIWQ